MYLLRRDKKYTEARTRIIIPDKSHPHHRTARNMPYTGNVQSFQFFFVPTKWKFKFKKIYIFL